MGKIIFWIVVFFAILVMILPFVILAVLIRVLPPWEGHATAEGKAAGAEPAVERV